MKRTEEQLRNLKVDVRRVAEWKNELQEIEQAFGSFSFERYADAVRVVALIDPRVIRRDSLLDRQSPDEIEKWLARHKEMGLARLADTYSAPRFVTDMPNYEDVISKKLLDVNRDLAEARARGVTNSFMVSMLTSKVSQSQVTTYENNKAEYLRLAIEIPKARPAISLLKAVWDKSVKHKARIVFLEKKLRDASLKLDALSRFESKHGNAFAKAAAVDKVTRQRGAGLKRIVPRTSQCAYCEGPLGADANLDHIYPVAKGGLSIVENLVWCCVACNSAKSDKGLMTFIQKRGIDVTQVLNRLSDMGKHV